MTAETNRRKFYARTIARDLLPLGELLSLSARALEGMLAELCVTEAAHEASEEQATLLRGAALDIAVTAIHVVGGADKLLLLAKLARQGEGLEIG
jgi:hypothetical protein